MPAAKPGIGVRYRVDTNPGRGDDLNRSTKVLISICVIAKEPCTASDINPDQALLSAQRKVWDNRHHQSAITGGLQKTCARDQSGFQTPRVITERP